jgi:hypothetical protein
VKERYLSTGKGSNVAGMVQSNKALFFEVAWNKDFFKLHKALFDANLNILFTFTANSIAAPGKSGNERSQVFL